MELPITFEEFCSHTINSVWMPQIGDNSLFRKRELINKYDQYAAAIVAIDHFKPEEVVGHVPLFLNKTLSKFLRLPGSYAGCKVIGTKINRGNGVGLEIPIGLTFVGKETATEWLKKHCIA